MVSLVFTGASPKISGFAVVTTSPGSMLFKITVLTVEEGVEFSTLKPLDWLVDPAGRFKLDEGNPPDFSGV